MVWIRHHVRVASVIKGDGLNERTPTHVLGSAGAATYGATRLPTRGVFPRGSVVFCKQLLRDRLGHPELADAAIALMDIDGVRLDVAKRMGEGFVRRSAPRARIEATLDQREAVRGAAYAVNMVQVGMHEATLSDKREHVYHAVMPDPLTAAPLTLDRIWAMCDELIEAPGDRLPRLR